MCGINHSATDAAQGNAQSNAMSALLPLHAEFNLAALPSSRFHHFSPHMPAKKSTPAPKSVEVLKHLDEKRRLIPSAEQQSIMHKEHELLRQIKYPRNTDLAPQIVWRGKDEQDWSDLATKVQAQLNSMITAAS